MSHTQSSISTMKKSPQHKPECPAKEFSIKEHLPPNKKLSDALPGQDDSEHCRIKYTRAITKRKKPINLAVKVKICTNAELVCFLLSTIFPTTLFLFMERQLCAWSKMKSKDSALIKICKLISRLYIYIII